MSDSVDVELIRFRGQKALRFPSGKIVTVEAWESITDDARRALLAGETSPDKEATDVD